MAANTLSILKPSVNNLAARVFVRAAGLDFEEVDVWGKKDDAGVPARRTRPSSRRCSRRRGCRGARSGRAARSCSTSATSTGSTSSIPTDPGERAMVDSAMFYLIGTLYPLVARATYPTLGFPQYAGEVATSDADDDMKAKAQKDAEAAIAEPLEAFRTFFLDGKRFIGGDTPSIADIRLRRDARVPARDRLRRSRPGPRST